MSNLNLKGIWIPIEILADKNLSDKEKRIYSIIMFLSKENNYCYCTNSNISELLNISITQVSKLVAKGPAFIATLCKKITTKNLFFYCVKK